ncbi:MAG: hypothetical protein HYX75_13180, partial [Acidobacteria bacterium]|nr:hypothetical protein [Acidobacteriota bacterium]
MVDALRKVRWTTVVLFLAALIGCSVGARRFLLQEETFAPGDPVIDAPASGQHAEPLTLEITEAMWAKAAFSPGLGTNTFTAKARVLARHPFVWVLRADVRIQDPSGRTVYTALQIKKVVCKHQPGKGDRMKECSATVDLAWTWNGRDPATGDILPDASYLTQ